VEKELYERIKARYDEQISPYYAAARIWTDAVIDPLDTSGNMNFVVSTACIKMKITPEEAINAATLNGAYAMGISKTHGSICKGKKANLIFTKPIPSYGYLPYAFGSNNIDNVMLDGEFFHSPIV
jgi:imidazolonepropionase-like amidohydrolase